MIFKPFMVIHKSSGKEYPLSCKIGLSTYTPFLILCWIIGLLSQWTICLARFDPTQPPGYTATTQASAQTTRQSSLSVTAIIISPQRRLAIVNDQVVKEGEEVFGIKVVAITPTSVKFHGAEGDFSIPFIDQVKGPASGKRVS